MERKINVLREVLLVSGLQLKFTELPVIWSAARLKKLKASVLQRKPSTGEHKAAALVVNKIDALLDKFSDQINSVFFSTKLIVSYVLKVETIKLKEKRKMDRVQR